jgi:hypothetical protein
MMMRYARPSCAECVRLAADSAALFQDYLDAKDAVVLTPKTDRAYVERRKHLEVIQGRLREAWKRERSHEESHRDEFH